ncbi:MAG TPA: SBBP repeat-containing protein [Bryobacteraceae bacterium]|nr:SBBP repeat-containing protein [Bryobacteraceae bacterium]
MRVLYLIGLVLAQAAISRGAEPSYYAPALQWVTSLGGSGTNTATAVAADTNGNLYIAGNTTSLDLPTVGAAQPHSGGSTLVRIDPASGISQNIYFQGAANLGTVQSVAADPENSQSIYASGSGGVFHSQDGGNTWTNLAPIPSAPFVYSIVVDPRNSKALYASTAPLGAFKSMDGGASWVAIDKGVPAAPDGTLDIYQIWVDPNSPAVLLASANTGLLRSANAGVSWTQVLGPVSGVTFDPFTPGTIYVCGPGSLGIAESKDDGQTWTPLPSLTGQGSWAVRIVADPFHQGTLYAGGYGLFQSTDAGMTWTPVGPYLATYYTAAMAADPSKPVLYVGAWPNGVLVSTDGFNTSTTLAPQLPQVSQILVAGASVFAVPMQTTDVFVAKLDTNGNIVYTTYFGGSGNDAASAIAVGQDGSVYVTGSTNSTDFPVTPGSYTGGGQASYVFKLKPDGSLAWSTFFADGHTTVSALAVDEGGEPYLAGSTSGYLPTTPGAYQTTFQQPPQVPCSFPTSIWCPLPFPITSAFLTKFNAGGSGLVFSTYIANDAQNNAIMNANALALAPGGGVYLAGAAVFLMNGSGSALLASNTQATVGMNAIALDGSSNVYVTGSGYPPVTAGAFQMSPVPPIPGLPGTAVGATWPAFVMKLDSGLSEILSATLLSGEGINAGNSIAIDSSGNAITGGNTTSKAFPTRAPSQGNFSGTAGSGYVAGLDPTLSSLLFSTFVGNAQPFKLAGVVPDGNGNILLAGSTPTTVFANKIALPPAPATRLDSVINTASRIAGSLSPGETVAALGAGFGSNAQLTIGGEPATVLSQTATAILAVVPSNIDTAGPLQVKVTAGGAVSNAVWMPAAVASPGIYSVNGSGTGQGYILNSDGAVNSPSNPVAMGSPITILATGGGQMQFVGQYAVTNLPVSVFVDGFYAYGIAAVVKQVTGLPGPVYEISVYVPNPAADADPTLAGFTMPPQVSVVMVLGNVNSLNPDSSALVSQAGIALSIKQ